MLSTSETLDQDPRPSLATSESEPSPQILSSQSSTSESQTVDPFFSILHHKWELTSRARSLALAGAGELRVDCDFGGDVPREDAVHRLRQLRVLHRLRTPPSHSHPHSHSHAAADADVAAAAAAAAAAAGPDDADHVGRPESLVSWVSTLLARLVSRASETAREIARCVLRTLTSSRCAGRCAGCCAAAGVDAAAVARRGVPLQHAVQLHGRVQHRVHEVGGADQGGPRQGPRQAHPQALRRAPHPRLAHRRHQDAQRGDPEGGQRGRGDGACGGVGGDQAPGHRLVPLAAGPTKHRHGGPQLPTVSLALHHPRSLASLERALSRSLALALHRSRARSSASSLARGLSLYAC
eukprot:539449-Rhodomonas_salina.1